MKVFWQDTETGETLPVVDGPAIPGKEVAAPEFRHHSQSWATQLRLMWTVKNYGPDEYDYATLVAVTPKVEHGDNEMLCGDQRFFQVPE